MGYVKYLTVLLKESLKPKCQDDQYNLNALCKKYDFIKVGIKFENEDNFKKKLKELIK